MGGSAKQVVRKVEKETKNVGRGVVHGGTQLAEGTKKMVNTTAAGLEGAGKALPGALEGFGKGLGSLGMEAMDGLKHNLDQVASVFMPGSGGGGEEGETASAANYSGSSKKGKAAGSAEGRMGKNRERLAKRDALKVRK
jgi:hypothetical protein